MASFGLWDNAKKVKNAEPIVEQEVELALRWEQRLNDVKEAFYR